MIKLKLASRLWVIVLAVIIAAGVALVVRSHSVTKYQSTAVLDVPISSTGADGAPANADDAEARAQDIVSLVGLDTRINRYVAGYLTAELQGGRLPTSQAAPATVTASRPAGRILNKHAGAVLPAVSLNEVNAVAGSISAVNFSGTALIEATYTARTPTEALLGARALSAALTTPNVSPNLLGNTVAEVKAAAAPTREGSKSYLPTIVAAVLAALLGVIVLIAWERVDPRFVTARILARETEVPASELRQGARTDVRGLLLRWMQISGRRDLKVALVGPVRRPALVIRAAELLTETSRSAGITVVTHGAIVRRDAGTDADQLAIPVEASNGAGPQGSKPESDAEPVRIPEVYGEVPALYLEPSQPGRATAAARPARAVDEMAAELADETGQDFSNLGLESLQVEFVAITKTAQAELYDANFIVVVSTATTPARRLRPTLASLALLDFAPDWGLLLGKLKSATATFD